MSISVNALFRRTIWLPLELPRVLRYLPSDTSGGVHATGCSPWRRLHGASPYFLAYTPSLFRAPVRRTNEVFFGASRALRAPKFCRNIRSLQEQSRDIISSNGGAWRVPSFLLGTSGGLTGKPSATSEPLTPFVRDTTVRQYAKIFIRFLLNFAALAISRCAWPAKNRDYVHQERRHHQLHLDHNRHGCAGKGQSGPRTPLLASQSWLCVSIVALKSTARSTQVSPITGPCRTGKSQGAASVLRSESFNVGHPSRKVIP